MIRSCYRTKMRFYPDRLDVETPVEWFFVDAATPWLKANNVFTSRNWIDGTEDWPLLGEVQGEARPWRDGSRVPAPLLHAALCGPADAFVSGVPFAL